MGDDDDDVVCVCVFPDCLLFPSLLVAAGQCMLCVVVLLSPCLMCAESNSVPIHMGGGSWGSVGKPRGALKNRHRHRHKTHRHTVMTHLGEVPIYLGTSGGSSQTQTDDGPAGQARSCRRSSEGGNECEGEGEF